MQRLEVSGALRPIYGSLGVKGISSHLSLVSQVVSFPQVSPPKSCIRLSHIRATSPAHLVLLDFITLKIFGFEYRSLRSSLCSFLNSLVTSSLLGQNILLQHPFPKHPKPTLLPSVSDQFSHLYSFFSLLCV